MSDIVSTAKKFADNRCKKGQHTEQALFELAMAVAEGQISVLQATRALKRKVTVGYPLGSALMRAVRRGDLVRAKKRGAK